MLTYWLQVQEKTKKIVEIARKEEQLTAFRRSTFLARAEEERLIGKSAVVMKRMQSPAFLQKNLSKGIKNGLVELEKLSDRISFYRRTWRAAGDVWKAETAALPAENTVSAKQLADCKANWGKNRNRKICLKNTLSK